MKRLVWLLAAVVIVAGLAAVRSRRLHETANAPTAAAVPWPVEVVTVRGGRATHSRHVLGTIAGAEEVEVAPRTMAQVLDVRVREGDVVRKGQVLVQLDARELQDAVAEAEASVQIAKEAVAAAERGYEVQRASTARDTVLAEAHAIAREQWDRSTAAEAAARAQFEAAKGQVVVASRRVSEARTRLGYARLTAPFDGVITARLADPGSLAMPGRGVVKLVHGRAVRVRASLPAADFAAVTPGTAVTLALGDTRIPARIARVVPAMGDAHLTAFEIDLADPPPAFVSGATIGVDVDLADAAGLIVPLDTLLDTDAGTSVWRVAGGTVHPVPVDVVLRSGDSAIVRGALAEGDRLVRAQPSRLMTLAEGTPVRVVDGGERPAEVRR